MLGNPGRLWLDMFTTGVKEGRRVGKASNNSSSVYATLFSVQLLCSKRNKKKEQEQATYTTYNAVYTTLGEETMAANL